MSFVVHRVAKSAARYTDAGGREKCGYCRFFVAPRACGKVIGPVSPAGWCKYFSRQAVSLSGGGISGGGSSPPPGVTLDLNFMNPGTLDPRITFTRASTALYLDGTGTMQTAATNAPRWDYDPVTHALRGLLIEEQRTNVLLNSAVLITQSVAVTAQAYTLSFYGTGTVSYSGAASGSLVGTGVQRVSLTFTPTAGTLTCTVTGSVTNAQLEAGSFSTSLIPTTSAAVTRARDLPIIPPNVSWYTAPGGSWFAEFIKLNPSSTFLKRVIQNTAASGQAQMWVWDGSGNALAQYDNVAAMNTANGVTTGAVSKGVTTWAPGTAKACLNGGAVASSAALTNGYPLDASGLFLMSVPDLNDSMTGYLRRVTYWNRALSDTEMQQVTT